MTTNHSITETSLIGVIATCGGPVRFLWRQGRAVTGRPVALANERGIAIGLFVRGSSRPSGGVSR